MRIFVIFLLSASIISCCPVDTLHTENGNDTSQIVLTRKTILAMLDSLQEAAENRFVSDLCEHFAPDIRIIMNLSPSDGNAGGVLELGLEEYRKQLEATWLDARAYSYVMKDVEITIQPGGKSAIATHTAVEEVDFSKDHIRLGEIGIARFQTKVTSKLKGRMSIIISDGKPKIMESYVEAFITSVYVSPRLITLK
ncbi:MAG: hypothetical protein QGH60_09780 [Phycisphaerae bacterium]|jgi:hypothetical protein|nr:hypothetical protein [Phycisphaerae bacterium]